MATLDIIVKPKLKFSLKKCGDVVPYGITPEEKAKLAGIEENANNYTHPETHPASILDVVDVVNGSANKFFNERGEMVAVATSSIGVTGSQLYASTANSDVAGYKSLIGTPQPLETEIILTAKSSDGIVWGAKYLSAPFTEAVTIPTTAYGFDYWRKVSAANGTSRKHLRVFLYRAGVETNIITPLASPDIEETEFTERQISYIFPELVLLAGDRIGIQEGFSTTHANNITLTYIVGDGRGWFMRLPLPLKHENLTDKNGEAAFQHVDTTVTKETLAEADKVALYDSVTGKVVLTLKENFVSDNLIASYTHSGNKEVQPTAVDLATGIFTANAHGLLNGNMIFPILNTGYLEYNFGMLKPLPTGLTFIRYFVVEVTTDTFKVATTIGGTAVTFTSNTDLNLAAWHFERNDTFRVNINGITGDRLRVEYYGYCFDANLQMSPSVGQFNLSPYGNKNQFIIAGTPTVGVTGRAINIQNPSYCSILMDVILTPKSVLINVKGNYVRPLNTTSNTIILANSSAVGMLKSNVVFDSVYVGYFDTSIINNGAKINIYKI